MLPWTRLTTYGSSTTLNMPDHVWQEHACYWPTSFFYTGIKKPLLVTFLPNRLFLCVFCCCGGDGSTGQTQGLVHIRRAFSQWAVPQPLSCVAAYCFPIPNPQPRSFVAPILYKGMLNLRTNWSGSHSCQSWILAEAQLLPASGKTLLTFAYRTLSLCYWLTSCETSSSTNADCHHYLGQIAEQKDWSLA